jgi:pimeloyl-ACP methyl ester carboxylesterase
VPGMVEYDEFGLFHENAEEFGLPYDGPPAVRREFVPVDESRRLSALVWGEAEPELFLIHGGAQNAHTWDTVAMALDHPLVAVDLPAHGHSDGAAPIAGGRTPVAFADDVSAVIAALAPEARAVVGMSLGGLTSIALADAYPQLVRKLVLVDVTPGVNAEKSKAIADFVRGPATFPDFDALLQRTIEHNPTRSVSSLRRGILHNAVQQPDGTWVWRYQRSVVGQFEEAKPDERDGQAPFHAHLWDALERIEVPLLLCRGMLEQSVVGDDDVAELLRRRPDAEIVEFPDAGHSIQGDSPLELAQTIAEFVY